MTKISTKTGATALLLATTALLSGCQVAYPSANFDPQPKLTKDPETVEDGITYLGMARAEMAELQHDLALASAATEFGALGGAVVSATGGILKWGTQATTKGVVVGSVSLAINNSLSPNQQIAVIDQGLIALDCLSVAATANVQIDDKIARRKQAIVTIAGELSRALDDANTLPASNTANQATELYAAQRNNIDKNTSSANDYIPKALVFARNIGSGPEKQLGMQIKIATDAIVTETNAQLHKLLPNAQAILNAASSINGTTIALPKDTTPTTPEPTPTSNPASPPTNQTAAPVQADAAPLRLSVDDAAKARQQETAANDKAQRIAQLYTELLTQVHALAHDVRQISKAANTRIFTACKVSDGSQPTPAKASITLEDNDNPLQGNAISIPPGKTKVLTAQGGSGAYKTSITNAKGLQPSADEITAIASSETITIKAGTVSTAPGTYTLVVSDQADGTVTDKVIITISALMTAGDSKPISIQANNTVDLKIANGKSPYTWTFTPSDGMLSSTADGKDPDILHISAAKSAKANAAYTMQITDSDKQSLAAPVALTIKAAAAQPPAALRVSIVPEPIKVGDSVTVSVAGGDAHYEMPDLAAEQAQSLSVTEVGGKPNQFKLTGVKAGGPFSITFKDKSGSKPATLQVTVIQ